MPAVTSGLPFLFNVPIARDPDGKDGGGKLRSRIPVTAASLEAAIDAMPMRRAGER